MEDMNAKDIEKFVELDDALRQMASIVQRPIAARRIFEVFEQYISEREEQRKEIEQLKAENGLFFFEYFFNKSFSTNQNLIITFFTSDALKIQPLNEMAAPDNWIEDNLYLQVLGSFKKEGTTVRDFARKYSFFSFPIYIY